MKILVIFVLIVVFLFPLTRFIIVNFPKITLGAIRDIYRYVKYKRWNECGAFGKIICYTGLFGQGKTKECVRYIVEQYKKYNGKKVFDDSTKQWVEQKIVVYSNVELNIPYVKLTSLQQLIDCQGSGSGIVNLFLIDEASVVFNSREFKKNFSTPALNTILTSRHHKIGILLTSQRFGHMDALLRQVTSYVYECAYFKPLRIQQIKIFDAWDCENCSNLLLLKPLQITYKYTSDKDYNNYNTYAMVEEISKDCKEGKFISDSEVLSNQGNMEGNEKYINKPSRKLKKRMK